MFTNISCYKFTPLDGLPALRERLLAFCKERSLKGTILLAPEGINLFIAGDAAAVDELVDLLRGLPGLADLAPKVSLSEHQPFSRMLVRLKKEIIAFGIDSIDPAAYTSPRLAAKDLKQWLDEGRPVVLLDTRNDYEVRLGTFRGAHAIGVDHFRDFPEVARQLPAEMKQMPVVTFCTGGIRCEKAAPWLEQIGFDQVWQLDGGILKYFEEVGADHYDGECFVFDQRVGLDPALRETGSDVCHACHEPLGLDELADPRHVPGVSCPYCFRDPQARSAEALARRQQALAHATTPLPGSVPADNRRPIRIPGRLDGATLGDVLATLFPHLPADGWEELAADGRLRHPTGRPAVLGESTRAGEEYTRILRDDIEPDVNGNIRVLHEDEALLVIDKPAPLPMHPCGRYNRNTLRQILHLAWHPECPRPAHRLDANTTGVLVCARTRHFAKLLQPGFARGEVGKWYLAKVHGHPADDAFVIDHPVDSEPGEAGVRAMDAGGDRHALTRFRVLTRHDDGTSTLEAEPVTGRTNQIRAHLWHAGYPIIGDPSYLTGGALGRRQTLDTDDAPLRLHSHRIRLKHPLSGEWVEFSCPPPADAGW